MPFINDVGTVLRATVKDQDGTVVDISSSSPKQIYVKRPDGSVLVKTGSFTTTGSDGKLQYATIAGDLNQPGPYSFWPKLTGVSSFTGRGTAIDFDVMGD
jgi:hypothetical protein